MHCPLCQTELPDDAGECSRCDWVRSAAARERAGTTRDRTAALLSVAVPGLGHLYKGHVLLGGAVFFLIGPAVLVLTAILLLPTFGSSLALPAAFMGGAAWHAFHADDRRAAVVARARALDRRQPLH